MFIMIAYPFFFFKSDNLDKETRDRQIIFYFYCVTISLFAWVFKEFYNLSIWVKIAIESLQLILILCLYFIDLFYTRMKGRLADTHQIVQKDYNPVNAVRKLKMENLSSAFKDNLYVDFVYIFYMQRSNMNDLTADIKNKKYVPRVAKYDLKLSDTIETDLADKTFKLHAQVVVMDDKRKAGDKLFFILGGAVPRKINADGATADLYDYDITDEIVVLNKNYDRKGNYNAKMLKRRINFRTMFIAENKLMILGGFNNEEETLNHCEILDLNPEKENIGHLSLQGTNKVYESTSCKPMIVKRQNFGITVLKSKPNEKENDTMKYFKVIVVGGWSGRHYLNSLEIYEVATDAWNIYHCNDNALIRCSYLGCCAFMDTDTGDKNEKIVIFGGQSSESEAYGKMMQSVEKNATETDMEAEFQLYYALEEKEQDGLLDKIEEDQLKVLKAKYDPELFEKKKEEMEHANEVRTVELLIENKSMNKYYFGYKNTPVKKTDNIEISFKDPLSRDDSCQFTLEELNDPRNEYLISPKLHANWYLFRDVNGVRFVYGMSKADGVPPNGYVWIVDEMTMSIRATSGEMLDYKDYTLSLSARPTDFTLLSIKDVEENFERLDTTEILNITKMIEDNKTNEYKSLSKDHIIECPELNFYTDHVLNGGMVQVSKDVYLFASADYVGRYNVIVNMWNYNKQLNPFGRFYGASLASWFDEGYE